MQGHQPSHCRSHHTNLQVAANVQMDAKKYSLSVHTKFHMCGDCTGHQKTSFNTKLAVPNSASILNLITPVVLSEALHWFLSFPAEHPLWA